jgi:carbon monoxide dehydrogenase subunit G
MARSEATIQIDRDRAQIFPWLVEPEKRLRWVRGLAASEPMGDGRYREVMEAGGRRVEVTSTVERLDEPHAVDVAMRGSGVTARAESRLAEHDGGTRVTSSLDLQLGGLLRFASGIAARQAQHSLEQSLARLKELVEAEVPREPREPPEQLPPSGPTGPTDALT